MKRYNLIELKEEFIERFVDINSEYVEKVRGKTFAELYPLGNDSIDSDINTFLMANNYDLHDDEKNRLLNKIYKYIF